jgi:hypothetical protein
MIKYRLVLSDQSRKTLQILAGEVSEKGKIEIEVEINQPPVRVINIEWESE